MPSDFNNRNFLTKGDIVGNFFRESEKRRSSGTSYVYDEEFGWIDVELFLDKIKKDINKIEQELRFRLKSDLTSKILTKR